MESDAPLQRQFTMSHPRKRKLSRYTYRSDLIVSYSYWSIKYCPVQRSIIRQRRAGRELDVRPLADHFSYPFPIEYTIEAGDGETTREALRDMESVYEALQEAMNVKTMTGKDDELKQWIAKYRATKTEYGYDDEFGWD